MATTRIASTIDRALETTWLTAVVATPALANVYSVRVFEGDKVPFLRSLAVIAIALWLLRALEIPGALARLREQRSLAVFGAIAVAATALLANAFAADPVAAFWGSYERVQGTYTLLASVALFGVFVATAGPQQIDRLATAVLIGSVVPSTYAVVQVLGFDPLDWGGAVPGRVHSTAGNPIFLGGYLIFAFPLALSRTIVAIEARSWGAFPVYAACGLTNALALACTQSRGPLLALAVGLLTWCLGAAAQRRRRRAALAMILSVAAATLAAAFVWSTQLPARTDAATATAADAGTARVRLLLWDGAAEWLQASGYRVLVGSGLDAFRHAYRPFFPPDLERAERRGATPDRAHNDTFDTLVHSGVLGLSAKLAMLAGVLLASLRLIGLRADPLRFVMLLLAVVGLNAVATHVRSPPFLGLAVGLSPVIVLAWWLARRAVQPIDVGPARDDTGAVLGLGWLAALIAHTAEIQVGIATATSQLLFWMTAAAVVAASLSDASDASEHGDAPLILGASVAALLATTMFSLSGALTGPEGPSTAAIVLLLIAWGAASALAVASMPGDAPGISLASFAIVSIGGSLAFGVAFVSWVGASPTSEDALVGAYVSHFATVHFVGVVALIAFGAITASLLGASLAPPPVTRQPIVLLVVAPVLLAGALWIGSASNLSSVRGDVYAKLGSTLERREAWARAAAMYERAGDLTPMWSRHALDRARVLTSLAVDAATADPGSFAMAATAAEQAAGEAWLIDPRETDNRALVARVHRRLAEAAPADRARHVAAAERYYALALATSPRRPSLWEEAGAFHLQVGQPEKAVEAFGRALELDPVQPELAQLRARTLADLERWDEAHEAFALWVELEPDAVEGWTGMAVALTRLERPVDAIAAMRQALEHAPDDSLVHRNLAALYRDQGELGRALQHARAGRELAAAKDVAAFDVLLSELERLRANAVAAE